MHHITILWQPWRMPQTACTSDQTEKQIMEKESDFFNHPQRSEGRKIATWKVFYKSSKQWPDGRNINRIFPTNTKKNTSLAKSCCQEWTSARNRKSAEEDKPQGPENLLENPDTMNWITGFTFCCQSLKQKGRILPLPPPHPQHHLKEHKRTLTSGTKIAEHALNTNYDTDWADA